MDSTTLFAAELNQDIPTIDLHHAGDVQRALDQLERELFLFSKEYPSCRVIYGIGTGVLARAVEDALEKNPLVGEWKRENTGGSSIVVF